MASISSKGNTFSQNELIYFSSPYKEKKEKSMRVNSSLGKTMVTIARVQIYLMTKTLAQKAKSCIKFKRCLRL